MPRPYVVHVIDYGPHRNLMLRYKHPVTRKPVAKTAGTRDQKKAEKLAARWEQELNDGVKDEASPLSWSEFRTRYRAEHLAGLSRRTEERSAGVLDLFAASMQPQLLIDVTAAMVSDYQSRLRAGKITCSNHGKTTRSEATVALHLRTLRAALSWAVEMGYLADLPKIRRNARTAKAAKSKVMKGRPITDAEFQTLLDAVPLVLPSHHVAAWQRLIRGLWLSGLRLDESLSLSWDDSRSLMVDVATSRSSREAKSFRTS